LLCVIIVILSWSLLSVSGTALTARLSQGAEGEGMGLFNAATALAGVTGAALGGWVAEHWGYHIALGLPVVGIALGLLLTLTVRPVLSLGAISISAQGSEPPRIQGDKLDHAILSSHGDPSIDPGGQSMPANDSIDMDSVIYRGML
jgi:MFS family permease